MSVLPAQPGRGGENRHGISGRVGMTPYIHARPAQLSGGQKQRGDRPRACDGAGGAALSTSRRARSIRRWSARCSMLCARRRRLTMIVDARNGVLRATFPRTSSLYDGVICEEGRPKDIFENPQDPEDARISLCASSWVIKDRSAATRCGLLISARPVDTRRTALV